MDELDLIIWVMLIVGSVGLLLAFIIIGGAWVLRTAQLFALDVQVKRTEVYRMRADSDLLLPGASGALPVPRALLANPDAAQFLYALAAQVVDAQRTYPNVPHTYSPHYSNNSEAGPVEMPNIAASMFHVPTFHELMRNNEFGNGRFLLGYADGQPVWGDWKQLYSTALGGMSGTGKSTTARFLLGQAAINGCKFVVIDPHANAGEESLADSLMPLRSHMLCDPASNDKSIIETARYVREIGRKRINGDSDRTPVLVAIDETTALLSRSSCGVELSEMIEEIAQEYRKVGVFALCSAQIWLASRSGGSSALRDSFASTYVHRMKRKQAGLLAPSGTGAEIEALPIGSALLWQTSGESTIVQIPLTTAADIVDIAAKNARTPVEPVPLAVIKSVPSSVPLSEQTWQVEPTMDSRAALVRQMYKSGSTQSEIIADVWGITTKGRAWQEASKELNGVLRSLIP